MKPNYKFILNQTVPFEEGPSCELKSERKDPVGSINQNVDRYVVAYLNSKIEGSIYWGITNDGEVVGVNLDKTQRDRVRQLVDQKLRNCDPFVSPEAYRITFYNVFPDEDATYIKDLFIVEVNVSIESSQDQLHYTGSHEAFLKTNSGTEILQGRRLEAEIHNRAGTYSDDSEVEPKRKETEDQPPGQEEPEGQSSQLEHPLEDFENPYDIARTAKSDMFKGRDAEIHRLQNAVRNGAHTAIFGLQRMGKTSLVEETLDRISSELKDKILFVKVDLQSEGRADTTYKDLLDAIVRGIRGIAGEILETYRRELETRLEFVDKGYNKGDRQYMLRDYKEILEIIVNGTKKKVVLFLDEFSELCQTIEIHKERSEDGSEMLVDIHLMHWFSALMKDLEELVFIIAVRPFVAEFDSRNSIQLLKLMNSITLYHLDKPAAEALMTDPLDGKIEFPKDCIDYLYDLTAGHPYLIQLFLHNIISQIQDEGRRIIEKQDIIDFETKMISDDSPHEAHFVVLDSDYSIASVTDNDYADRGKGVLGLIAKLGGGGWVQRAKVREVLIEEHEMVGHEIDTLLAQFRSAKITEERRHNTKLEYRISIPLLRERYIKQNMYERYFR